MYTIVWVCTRLPPTLFCHATALEGTVMAAAAGVVTDPAMATSVLDGLVRRGLFNGTVLTTCWFAGATLDALYQLGKVSTNGRAAEVALQYMQRTGKRSWMEM